MKDVVPGPPPPADMPRVSETLDALTLQFSDAELQSRMRLREPDALDLQYTRTMMGFLMFVERPARIALIGLGGGSLVKFCHRHVGAARLDVVEINPQVIALRERFCVPDDDARLRVIAGDGADYVRQAAPGCDVLLVDGFDASGLPRALCSQRFYDDSADLLGRDGLMVANLHAGAADHPVWLERIRRSFGDAVLVAHDADHSNDIVFAFRSGRLPAARAGRPRCPAGLAPAAWPALRSAFARIASALDSKRAADAAAPR